MQQLRHPKDHLTYPIETFISTFDSYFRRRGWECFHPSCFMSNPTYTIYAAVNDNYWEHRYTGVADEDNPWTPYYAYFKRLKAEHVLSPEQVNSAYTEVITNQNKRRTPPAAAAKTKKAKTPEATLW